MTAVTMPAAGVEYLRTIPTRDAIPAGRVVVHNHVNPTRRLGSRGFRAWLQRPNDRLVLCECGWAPELGAHYLIPRPGRPPLRSATPLADR